MAVAIHTVPYTRIEGATDASHTEEKKPSGKADDGLENQSVNVPKALSLFFTEKSTVCVHDANHVLQHIPLSSENDDMELDI